MTTSISSSNHQPAAAVDSQQQLLLPKPTKFEVHACQFSSWYSTFRSISKSSLPNNRHSTKVRKHVTIESKIIKPLPQDFIEYLLSDGVLRLPLCAGNVSSCLKDDTTRITTEAADDEATANDDNDDDNEDDEWNDSDSDNNSNSHQYNFPTLTNQIHQALTTLGGTNNNNKGIFPKLNWSSPKDATWMNCGTLKCTTVGDVYLLLKSSEFVLFDLECAWDDLEIVVDDDDAGNANVVAEEEEKAERNAQEDNNNKTPINNNNNKFEYELVLRKWCNLHPSMEFRCFIYNHQLIAISQRHPTKFYSHLQLPPDQDNDDDDDEEVQQQQQHHHPTYVEIIQDFHETYVQNRFADGQVHRYVMDVYVDSQERTWIVDFNVWGTRTDALLFDWVELMTIGQDCVSETNDNDDDVGEISVPEVRVVTKDMKDLTYDPLSSFRGPTDVMSLMGAGSNDDGGFEPSSFKDFMEQCVRPSEM